MNFKVIAALCLLAQQVYAFVPHQQSLTSRAPHHCLGMSSSNDEEQAAMCLYSRLTATRAPRSSSSDGEHSLVSVLSEKRGLCGYVSKGMAASDDIEIAELPPPYVPALFGVALLAGVGVLTASLGNVMDEGMYCRLHRMMFQCVPDVQYDRFLSSRY
jgi:hypothetical protein